jgi:hypothetical protein
VARKLNAELGWDREQPRVGGGCAREGVGLEGEPLSALAELLEPAGSERLGLPVTQ